MDANTALEIVLGEVLDRQLWDIILETCREIRVKPMVRRPHKAKSRKVDEKMQKILDDILVEELACILSNTGLSTAAKAADDLLGETLIKLLSNKLHT
jgi:hypothetical protein